MSRASKSDLVTLEPTGKAFIPGVPAERVTVTEEEAKGLLAWDPPAFRIVEPAAPAADLDSAKE